MRAVTLGAAGAAVLGLCGCFRTSFPGFEVLSKQMQEAQLQARSERPAGAKAYWDGVYACGMGTTGVPWPEDVEGTRKGSDSSYRRCRDRNAAARLKELRAKAATQKTWAERSATTVRSSSNSRSTSAAWRRSCGGALRS